MVDTYLVYTIHHNKKTGVCHRVYASIVSIVLDIIFLYTMVNCVVSLGFSTRRMPS